MITKSRAQVLTVLGGEKASIMDMETFETLEVPIIEEVRAEIKEGDQVEYWDVEGVKIIKRKI
jgi:translation initiation factor 5A